jgi:hypothetical protein
MLFKEVFLLSYLHIFLEGFSFDHFEEIIDLEEAVSGLVWLVIEIRPIFQEEESNKKSHVLPF